VGGGVVDEAHVHSGCSDLREARELLGDPFGLGKWVEGVLVLEHDFYWCFALRPCRGIARAGQHLAELGGAEPERRPTVAERNCSPQ